MQQITRQCPNCCAPIHAKNGASLAECEYCGSVFQIAKETTAEPASQPSRELKAEYVGSTTAGNSTTSENGERKTWLWILGWILCWPVTFTVLMLNSKTTANLNPKIRWGIVIAVWLLIFMAAIAE